MTKRRFTAKAPSQTVAKPASKVIKLPNASTLPKLFILDTCVLMLDPRAIFAFKEHHVYVPPVVLGQLDNHKKGFDENAYNTRESTRSLVEIHMDGRKNGVYSSDLTPYSNGEATGHIHASFPTVSSPLLSGKCDNADVDTRLIEITKLLKKSLQDKYSDVVLVSLDGMLILTALEDSEDVSVEFYKNGRVEDISTLYSGVRHVENLFETATIVESTNDGEIITDLPGHDFRCNEYIQNTHDGKLYRTLEVSPKEVVLKCVPLRDNAKNAALYIGARKNNLEQSAALDILRDVKVPLVSIQGTFGSGKTLLAIATGIELVMKGYYDGIVYVRSITTAGGKAEELGFMPGTQGKKTAQWRCAIDDSLESICAAFPKKDGNIIDSSIDKVLSIAKTKITFQPIQNIRGRTFFNKYVIIDEGQNLSWHTLLAILSRGGENSKITILSDINQIDKPYLDVNTCGVTHFAKMAQSSPMCAIVNMPICERSPLARYVESLMSYK